MRTFLFLLTFQFSLIAVQAQKMYEEQFSNCPLKFILEDNEAFIDYEPNDSLLVIDFLKGIEPKQIEKIMGTLMMQIMVDTSNQICCVSYSNKTTMNSNKLDIQNRVISMKGWKRNSNALPEENICALVSILFDKQEISVLRTGYNRNKGRNTMKSTTFKRFIETGTVDSENKEIEK